MDGREGPNTMSINTDETWLSRRQLADRYGLPITTLAQWASKGTGPRYARMGRHVRYRLSDVIDWEKRRFENKREDGAPPCALAHCEQRPIAQAECSTTVAGRLGD
jgi:predicted DNA-binding transcriptional regulator AlpA